MSFGRIKNCLEPSSNMLDGFFYTCEFLKECDKVSPQCRDGGNSYCGEYKKRLRNHKK